MVNRNEKPSGKARKPTSKVSASGEQATGLGTNNFGPTLRRLRDARDLSQGQLAEKAGMSIEAIGALERGTRRQPRKETVQLLADALALSPGDRGAFEAAAGYRRPEEEPPIGREREWERLRREFAGEMPMIVISGGPGIGKSHLLGAATRWAGACGWQLLPGGCHRDSGQEPYAPITEAIKRSVRALPHERKIAALSGCGWLARLLPELLDEGVLEAPQRTLPSGHERRLMFDAVVRYLENIGAEAGTLLVLDDVQWAGADSMLLLAHLIRSVRPGRIRILAAYRTTEIDQGQPFAGFVADLAKDHRAARLELAPLAHGDATRLASDVLRPLLEHVQERAGRELVQGLVQRTDRIPLFLVLFAKSLLELALERDAHAARDAASGSASSREALGTRINSADLGQLPWSIAQYVHHCLAALPSSTRDLLAVAAVAAEMTPGEVLAECLGRSEIELLPDFEAACASDLLVASPMRGGRVAYHYSHELLREAVEGTLSAQRKTLVHRAMGEALERHLGDHWRQREDLFPRLAYHVARSGQPGKAVIHLRLAGDQARRMYAHQQAAKYYDELVTYLDELRREREAAEARSNLAEELTHIGRYADAIEALTCAGDTYRGLGDLESLAMVTAHIASAHASRGTVSAGLAELLPIVEGIALALPNETEEGMLLSPAVRAWLLATLSHLCFMDGRYEEALRAATQCLDVAQTTGDTALMGGARLQLGVAQLTLGHTTHAATNLDEAIACARSAGRRDLLVEARLMAIWTHQTRGDFVRSREMQDRVLAEAQEFGSLASLGHAFFLEGLLAFYTGEWGRARDLAEQSASALGQLDASQLGSYPPLGIGWLFLVSGRREEAMQHLDHARTIAEHSDGEQVLRLIAALLAEDELVRGQGEAACERLASLFGSGTLQERMRIELQTLRAWGTLRVGTLAEAEAMALDTVQRARHHDMRLLMPDALRVRALCAIERKDWSAATDALEEALALCQAMPYLYAEAKVHYVYGQLCLARHEPRQAREHFECALAICGALGERLYGAVIERELALAGLAEIEHARIMST